MEAPTARPKLGCIPMRTAIFGTLLAATLSFMIALPTLHDVFLGCDYGPIGLGRPACEANLSMAYTTLRIALAAGTLLGAVALIAARSQRRQR
jgi:ABC-type Fe3+ transport system permease subunit